MRSRDRYGGSDPVDGKIVVHISGCLLRQSVRPSAWHGPATVAGIQRVVDDLFLQQGIKRSAECSFEPPGIPRNGYRLLEAIIIRVSLRPYPFACTGSQRLNCRGARNP